MHLCGWNMHRLEESLCETEQQKDWRKSKKKKKKLLKKVLGECWNSKNKTHKHWLKRFAEVFESAFFIIWHLIISAIRFLKKVWVFGLVMIL